MHQLNSKTTLTDATDLELFTATPVKAPSNAQELKTLADADADAPTLKLLNK